MYKDFNFHITVIGDIFDFFQRQFAGKYDTPEVEGFEEFHTGQIAYRHLCAGMKRQIRNDFVSQPGHSQILHKQSVNGNGIEKTEIRHSIFHFLIRNQGIQSYVYRYITGMTEMNGLFHFFVCEISGEPSGAE